MTNLNFKTLGTGEPVFLLHGYLETAKMWGNMITNVKNHQFILPDLLGHGKTKKSLEINTMEAQAAEIIQLMDDLGIQKAKLVGHSMGGYIALSIARDFPERVAGLFLFYSKSLPDSDEGKRKRDKVAEIAPKNKSLFIRNSITSLFKPEDLDKFSEELGEAIAMAEETTVKGIVACALGMKERKDTTDILYSADYPIYIQLGENDVAVDISYLNEIPKRDNIQIKVTKTGHLGHYEAPEESREFLIKFLKA